MPPVHKEKRSRNPIFLRQWRKFRDDMSLAAAAPHLRISKETLGRIERGILPYNQDVIERAADLYRCTPEDILTRDPFSDQLPWSIVTDIVSAPKNEQRRLRRLVDTFLKGE